MINFEEQQIEQHLKQESHRNLLYKQLAEIIDYTSLSYDVSFIPTEYFVINDQLKAAPYVPKSEYLIEGNAESKELVIPPHALKVTSMLRPNRNAIGKYMFLMEKLNIKKMFFQPFLSQYEQNMLTLYNTLPQGGIVVRIGEVKDYDLIKAI